MDSIEEEDYHHMVTLKGASNQYLFKQDTILQKIRDRLSLPKLSVHTLFLEAIKVFLIYIMGVDDFRSKDIVEKHHQNWNVEVKKA